MNEPRLLDLHFGGREHAIGVYVVDTDDGLALFDCGPSSTLPALEAGLAREGLELSDVRHLLLSHIHLDHAGAAGPLVRANGHLTVWVSEIGAPHLIDPSRLERSARRLYGDAFDPLWGELAPVPEQNVRIASGDVLGWAAFPTPGHASHHVSYLRDGTLLAGDACGVRMPGAAYVLPVSPPPDVDVEAWHAIRRRDPASSAGPTRADPLRPAHATRACISTASRTSSTRWAARVEDGMTQDEFVAAARADAGADADDYDQVAPLWQSWHGLRRYWDTAV